MKTFTLFISLVLLHLFAVAHPLKMAYTSVKYDAHRKVFEITHRVFQDDFENTLKASYNYVGDVFLHQNSAESQRAVTAFFQKNFSISMNNVIQKLTYKKVEQKNQMGLVVYFETNQINPSTIKFIAVYNYIMMESFKEQVNMFHLNINEQVKRTLKFEKGRTRERIEI